MSAILNNISAVWRHIAARGEYPAYKHFSVFSEPDHLVTIDTVREYFTDETSRNVFDWFCQYRIVEGYFGAKYADLLPNAPYPAEAWAEIVKKAEAAGLPSLEGDDLFDRMEIWLLEAYALKNLCEVAEGDVVFDCGAFTGNSCLYFAQKAGPRGRVYGFEPIPSLFEQLKKNMAATRNVTPINAAIAAAKGRVFFKENGVASHRSERGDIAVYQLSIDEFVESSKLERLDFIKMDIEGAEEEALEGARESIKRFRPKMALSAYHKDTDIVNIPLRVRGILPEYSFALRHNSNTKWSTILYCYLQ
jgi:FkbM family methyltransferase